LLFFGQRFLAAESELKSDRGFAVGVTAVYLLLSLILVIPFACLALLCLVALLGVATIAVALNLIRTAKSVFSRVRLRGA
jgi:hypothetical protein